MVSILREADAGDKTIVELCRTHAGSFSFPLSGLYPFYGILEQTDLLGNRIKAFLQKCEQP